MIYSCIQRDLDSCSNEDDPCIQQEVLDGSLPYSFRPAVRVLQEVLKVNLAWRRRK